MLRAEPDTRIERKLFQTYLLIIFTIFLPIQVFAQIGDSLEIQNADSLKTFSWRPKILPELNQFNPQNVSHTLQLVVPKTNKSLKYYDPKNVMPKNFWEMDYRETSYYTPRIVSDRLAQMMDRLPPDSFLPLPTVAFLAASIALKYADIQFKIEIRATDYLMDERLESILISLLQKSPHTAKDIYQSEQINNSRTMEVLENDLQTLIDKKIIKKRIMDTEPDKYYAAQDLVTVINLIECELETDSAATEQKQKLSGLLRKLSDLQENFD